ncbi:MAG: DUF3617 domain-containing protein [Steroidobacteraceae bacterium]
MNTYWQSSGRLLAAASLILIAAVSARADDPPGVLWETTSQMVMEGMPMAMPANKGNYCAKETWEQPPASGNDPSQNCRNTSFNQTGTKVTWSMACDNPPMTGDGEITFNGTDSYAGVIRFQGAQMNMQVNLAGKKIGTCDNPT